MRCKKWRLAAWAVSLAGCALLIAGWVDGRASIQTACGVALALAGMVIHAAKFRCPACGRHISDRVPLSITHCPFCGAVLEDKEARK